MCPPDYYRVDYVINPWMKVGSVNTSLAKKQWGDLYAAYRSLGVTVHLITPDAKFPDQVFATDQGVVIDGKIFLSRFAHDERKGETSAYLSAFGDLGLEVIESPSTGLMLEGGDVLRFGKNGVLIGHGKRTNMSGLTYVQEQTGLDVLPITLANDEYYHLDTCVFPLNEEVVFYSPAGISEESAELLEATFPVCLEFTEAEARNFASNSVVIGDTVLVQAGNRQFIRALKAHGFDTIELDMSEFMKSGGGIHCLTLIVGHAGSN